MMSAAKRRLPLDSTQLWKSLTELGVVLAKSTKGFDRSYRFTLGERLMNTLVDLTDDWMRLYSNPLYGGEPKYIALEFHRDFTRLTAVLNIAHILGQFSHENMDKLLTLVDSINRQFKGYCDSKLHISFELEKDN